MTIYLRTNVHDENAPEVLRITLCSECRYSVPIAGCNCLSCTVQNGAVHAPDGFCEKGLPTFKKFKDFDERVRGADE